MHQEIKEEWIEALRSGKYKQATGKLRVDDSYCCLGLLCEIQGAEWRPLDRAPRRVIFALAIDGRTDYPATEYRADLSMIQMRDLAEMNDRGKTFAEIADHIEKNL